MGNTTAFAYDSVGNLTSVTDAMGYVTSYAYDSNNNRVSQTDANGNTATMAYDELNRLVKRMYPNGDAEEFGYDANSNMVFKVDGEGDSTIYAFDSRSREVLRRYTDSGHTVRTMYTPDSRRDSVIDYRGVTTYLWGDCCGQLVRVDNPDGTFIEYEYDLNKNKTAMITPWARTEYRVDALNRMDSVIADDGSVTEYFYNAVGNRDSVYHHGNGTSTGYWYDDLNQLTKVINYGPGGVVLSSFEYELNNAGIRTAVTESDGSRVDYSYDLLYRLSGETRTGTNPYSIAFTYDNVGNRLTQVRNGVTTSYTYNDRDQLETETGPSGTTTYSYDGAGRLGEKVDPSNGLTYMWVDNNRLAAVLGSTTDLAYEYDAEGIKVKSSDGGAVTNYLVDHEQPYAQVVAEYDNSLNPTVNYTFGLERISQDRGGSISFFAADAQGSIRHLTNAAANVTDSYHYFAFGELLAKTGSTQNDFLFTGEALDPNSGFYYLRARHMDPATGRLVSVDPAVGDRLSPISLHRYLYGNASPISFHDPSGRVTMMQVMTTIAVVGILATNVTCTRDPSKVSKTVTINMTYLYGSTAGGSAGIDLWNAEIQPQTGVKLKTGTTKVLEKKQTEEILGVDLVLEEYSDPSSLTEEELALLSVNQGSGRVTAYFVKELSMGSAGISYGGAAAGFAVADGLAYTFAHELGHVLLGSAGHDAPNAEYLMHKWTKYGTKVTPGQALQMRLSPYAK